MRLPTFTLVRHVIAYLLGAFFVGWGLWCFGYELLYPAQVARESAAANGSVVLYAPSMFAGVIVYLGIVLLLMPRFDVVSGALILLGSIVAGFAMVFLAYLVGDEWGRFSFTRELPAVAFLGFLLVLGGGSVVVGVMWLRHKKKLPPNNRLQATPV